MVTIIYVAFKKKQQKADCIEFKKLRLYLVKML